MAASREPRLSKPGPLIADPSNAAAPATASHCAAAAAAEAERKIRAEISTQQAAEGSPIITPPPETPTTTISDKQPLSSIHEDNELDDSDNGIDKLANLRNNLARRTTKTKRRAHVPVNGDQSDLGLKIMLTRKGCMMTFTSKTFLAEVKMRPKTKLGSHP
jgi:hypothetical protein